MCIVRPCKFDYSENRTLIYRLRKAFPFAEYSVIGRSNAGRAVFSLSIGTGETKILYAGGFGGKDALASLVLYRFFEELCEAVNNGRPLCGLNIESCLEGRKITVIPCLNPDGIEIFQYGSSAANAYRDAVMKISGGIFTDWNANAAGIDLGMNFDCDSDEKRLYERKNGISSPCVSGFGGKFPESEPETKALMKLCRSYEFHHAFSFFTSGEEIFFERNKNTPRESLMMAKVMSSASGYTTVSNEGFCPDCVFKNSFIDETHRPAFAVRLGKGEKPLAVKDLEEVYSSVREMLVLGAIL